MARASFKKLLKEKYPQANRLAIEWLFEGLLLFDTKSGKPHFEESKVALYLGAREAIRLGIIPELNLAEQKALKSICHITQKNNLVFAISKIS